MREDEVSDEREAEGRTRGNAAHLLKLRLFGSLVLCGLSRLLLKLLGGELLEEREVSDEPKVSGVEERTLSWKSDSVGGESV
jgi:hypothetical protein